MDTNRSNRILIVDDDPGHLATLKTITRSWGYAVQTTDDGDHAVERATTDPFDLILMDIRMARISGIEALAKIKAYNPSIPVLIMTAYSSVASAIDALKAGAYDYLIKPLDFEVLKLTLERTREHAGLKVENELLKRQLHADLDGSPASVPTPSDGTRSLEEIEKEAIVATLKATNGNKSECARRLGITRKTLHNKLKNFGIG